MKHNFLRRSNDAFAGSTVEYKLNEAIIKRHKHEISIKVITFTAN